MTPRELLELALAAVLLGLAVWLYRRPQPGPDGGAPTYGSQGAVLLIVVAVILAVHALGLLDYQPSPAEIAASEAR